MKILALILLTGCASTPSLKMRPKQEYTPLECRHVRDEPKRDVLIKQLTQEAADHFAAGQYKDAIGDWEEANHLIPNSAFLYNIAQAYAKLSLYHSALDYMEQFIRVTSSRDDADRAQERYSQLQQLELSWDRMHGGQAPPLSAYEWSHRQHDDMYPNGHKHGLDVCHTAQ